MGEKKPVLSEDRVKELMDRFNLRLKNIPFTMQGIPYPDEIQLTKDIWEALKKDEKDKITSNAAKVLSKDKEIDINRIPDQTPYAMRITHRYMQMKSFEV